MSRVDSEADTFPATAHDGAVRRIPPDPLVGTMIGSYQVVELLGKGGMGSVYRAVHPRIGTEVAIKVLHPSLARSSTVTERFEREARASGAIGSPYIPKFYDFGVLADGCTYAVLDYYDGESLADRIERGPIPLPLAKTLLIQASRALGDAHRQGIIHRDVKPDNLFVVRDANGEESVRVLDFGIAKVTHDKDLTHAGVFLGTPHYCAPEQLRAKDPAPPMDIYALGSTAFEMLTGVPPFDGDLHTLIRRKTEGDEPDTTPLDALPTEVRETILKAIAFEAEDRYADMTELEEALATWLPAAPTKRRSLWPIAAAALLVIAAFAATVILVTRSPTADTAPSQTVTTEIATTMETSSTMNEPVEPVTMEATLVDTSAMDPTQTPAKRTSRMMRMRARMSVSRAMNEPDTMTQSMMSTTEWLDWNAE